MLRNCACFQRQRRGSSFEDSSSCRSSEIERGSEVSTSNGSLLKLITSRGWCRQWRKTGSTISMSKIERSKHKHKTCSSYTKAYFTVFVVVVVYFFYSANIAEHLTGYLPQILTAHRWLKPSYSQCLFRINYHYGSNTLCVSI